MKTFGEYLTESINDIGIFKSGWILGSPGSGKSYTLKKIKSGSIEPRIINTDKVFSLYKGEWNNWAKIQYKVKILNKKIYTLYINSMLPLFIDSTSTSPQAILRRKSILDSLGYDTDFLVFINTDLDIALERASKRERKVDSEFIKYSHQRSEEAKQYLRSKFKYFIEINNNDGELTNDVILSAYKKLIRYYNSPIENPIGQNIKKDLLEIKGKYYTDLEKYNMTFIKKYIDYWYMD